MPEKHEFSTASFVCAMCGKALLVDEDVRYIVHIQVYAAYDPMELTAEDLEKDRREEIKRLVEEMGKMDPRELEDQVYKEFRFNICPPCQRAYLQDPLPRSKHHQ